MQCGAVCWASCCSFKAKYSSPKEVNQSYKCEAAKSQYSGSEVTDLDDSHVFLPATLSRSHMARGDDDDDISGSLCASQYWVHECIVMEICVAGGRELRLSAKRHVVDWDQQQQQQQAGRKEGNIVQFSPPLCMAQLLPAGELQLIRGWRLAIPESSDKSRPNYYTRGSLAVGEWIPSFRPLEPISMENNASRLKAQ
jgi:hypothetical protein